MKFAQIQIGDFFRCKKDIIDNLLPHLHYVKKDAVIKIITIYNADKIFVDSKKFAFNITYEELNTYFVPTDNPTLQLEDIDCYYETEKEFFHNHFHAVPGDVFKITAKIASNDGVLIEVIFNYSYKQLIPSNIFYKNNKFICKDVSKLPGQVHKIRSAIKAYFLRSNSDITLTPNTYTIIASGVGKHAKHLILETQSKNIVYVDKRDFLRSIKQVDKTYIPKSRIVVYGQKSGYTTEIDDTFRVKLKGEDEDIWVNIEAFKQDEVINGCILKHDVKFLRNPNDDKDYLNFSYLYEVINDGLDLNPGIFDQKISPGHIISFCMPACPQYGQYGDVLNILKNQIPVGNASRENFIKNTVLYSKLKDYEIGSRYIISKIDGLVLNSGRVLPLGSEVKISGIDGTYVWVATKIGDKFFGQYRILAEELKKSAIYANCSYVEICPEVYDVHIEKINEGFEVGFDFKTLPEPGVLKKDAFYIVKKAEGIKTNNSLIRKNYIVQAVPYMAYDVHDNQYVRVYEVAYRGDRAYTAFGEKRDSGFVLLDTFLKCTKIDNSDIHESELSRETSKFLDYEELLDGYSVPIDENNLYLLTKDIKTNTGYRLYSDYIIKIGLTRDVNIINLYKAGYKKMNRETEMLVHPSYLGQTNIADFCKSAEVIKNENSILPLEKLDFRTVASKDHLLFTKEGKSVNTILMKTIQKNNDVMVFRCGIKLLNEKLKIEKTPVFVGTIDKELFQQRTTITRVHASYLSDIDSIYNILQGQKEQFVSVDIEKLKDAKITDGCSILELSDNTSDSITSGTYEVLQKIEAYDCNLRESIETIHPCNMITLKVFVVELKKLVKIMNYFPITNLKVVAGWSNTENLVGKIRKIKSIKDYRKSKIAKI